MDKIRTFVAISLDSIPALTTWIEEFRQHHADDNFKWTDSRQWHVTLKFIGDIRVSEVPELSGRLSLAFKDVKAGNIVVEGSGFFGSADNPKVLWAGIRESEWLKDLQRKTAEASSGYGLSGQSGAFNPHLTLARVNFVKDPSRLIEEVNQKKNTVWCERETDRVILFQSKLTQKGPVYSVLKQFELG